MDRIFAALSDATRRDIVTRVMAGESSVSALAKNYDMSFAGSRSTWPCSSGRDW